MCADGADRGRTIRLTFRTERGPSNVSHGLWHNRLTREMSSKGRAGYGRGAAVPFDWGVLPRGVRASIGQARPEPTAAASRRDRWPGHDDGEIDGIHCVTSPSCTLRRDKGEKER